MESFMLSPVSPSHDLTYVQFWLPQIWNLESINWEPSDQHQLDKLSNRPWTIPKGK